MDLELLFWVLVFVGGYGAILGYLLRIAIRNGEGGRSRSPKPPA